ncbi:calcium ion binding protein [Aureococcus anophagefferens]|nr:calcium ion binding protein [Aureococcus anophagefferens]
MFGVWAGLCLAVGAAARDAPVARETDFFSAWLRRSALFDGSSPWAPGDAASTGAAPGPRGPAARPRDAGGPEHLAALVERTEAVDVRDAEGAKDEALRSRLRSADDVAAALDAGASVVVKLEKLFVDGAWAAAVPPRGAAAVFAVQVAGAKAWRLCVPHGPDPAASAADRAELAEARLRTRGCTSFEGEELAVGGAFASCEAATVAAGETLYVPKGVAHAARTPAGGAVSAHVAVAAERDGGRWVDVFLEALDAAPATGASDAARAALVDDLQWREPLAWRAPFPAWDATFHEGAAAPSPGARDTYGDLVARLSAEAVFSGADALEIDALRKRLAASPTSRCGLSPRGVPLFAADAPGLHPRAAWLAGRADAAAPRTGAAGPGPPAPRRLAAPSPLPTPTPTSLPTLATWTGWNATRAPTAPPTATRAPTAGCGGNEELARGGVPARAARFAAGPSSS